MSKALSLDLRNRVLAAVASGLSHRQAGERFNVSAASVSRWRTRERFQGDARPKALGGDRRSGRVDSCRPLIDMVLAKIPDITIAEMQKALAGQGHVFGSSTIQRFFKRHKITRKKRRLMPQNRIARIS
jgi:transposase